MNSCKQLSKEHLRSAICVNERGADLDLRAAKAMAEKIAKTKVPDPMLLAWYERKTGRFSPPVECCGEEKPSWLIYAESRGGDIIVNINDLEYVFVFRDSSL